LAGGLQGVFELVDAGVFEQMLDRLREQDAQALHVFLYVARVGFGRRLPQAPQLGQIRLWHDSQHSVKATPMVVLQWTGQSSVDLAVRACDRLGARALHHRLGRQDDAAGTPRVRAVFDQNNPLSVCMATSDKPCTRRRKCTSPKGTCCW
jgi:hypothetical protein